MSVLEGVDCTLVIRFMSFLTFILHFSWNTDDFHHCKRHVIHVKQGQIVFNCWLLLLKILLSAKCFFLHHSFVLSSSKFSYWSPYNAIYGQTSGLDIIVPRTTWFQDMKLLSRDFAWKLDDLMKNARTKSTFASAHTVALSWGYCLFWSILC